MPTASSTAAALPHVVKLVVWDLDDTLWRGTLTDGPVVIPEAHIELVKTLCRRGVMSSICSKNDPDAARVELERCGLWPFLVFPRMAFEPKGALVADIISRARLRPENVLFIDDNPLNLAEARHVSPGLMTGDPAELLPDLPENPQLRGKDDADLSRLRHYKELESKIEAQASAPGGAEAFLRTSGIQIRIEMDVEAHLERVVELINRSNQLNYTKVRLEGEAELDDFRRSLKAFGARAGAVYVKDKYSDYGLVGFYLLFNRAGGNRLTHFVHEHLGRPALEVVEPVTNSLQEFPGLNWIRFEDGCSDRVLQADGRLTLIGGCDLLQVASSCSADRAEYVNHTSDGTIVHYDDAGFVLSPRPAAAASATLRAMPCWTAGDALRFDQDLAGSELVIVSLWDALLGQYLVTDDGVLVRVDAAAHGLQAYMRAHPDAPFIGRCRFLQLSPTQKAELIRASLERIAGLSGTARRRVVLGRNLTGVTSGRRLRRLYNETCRAYARETGLFHFLDLDETVEASDVIDDAHLTRSGYHRIAVAVQGLHGGDTPTAAAQPSRATRQIEVNDLVRRAWFRRSGAPLGPAAERLLGLLHHARLA